MEADRVDGSGEYGASRAIALPMMLPGLFPITVAMYMMLNRGGSEPVLYALEIAGAAIAVIPVIALVLTLQRFRRLDPVKGRIT